MNFVRLGEWYEMSECQRYTVAASKVGGAFKFQAWRLVPGGVAQLLGTKDEAEAARDLCRADSPTTHTESDASRSSADTAEVRRAVRS
jgi:hypothetical protein